MNKIKQSLLTDWRNYCKGDKEFDKFHFQTLFHIDPILSKQELIKIFKYFPHSNLLLERMLILFKAMTFDKNTHYVNSKLQMLVLTDIKEKLRICYDFDEEYDDLLSTKQVMELPQIITNNKDIFNEKKEDVYNNIDNYLIECLGDKLSEILNKKQDQVWGLLEAFYGLTTDFTIKWYLATPLYSEPVNFDAYVNIWKAGAEYIITKDEILIYKPID